VNSTETVVVTLKMSCVSGGGKSGPKVTVNYSGLLEAPKNVHAEEITGHSAVVTWNRGWL